MLESVKVWADQLLIEPVVAGVPVFAPLVKFHETEADETNEVTPAASSVTELPSRSKAPVSGEIRLTGFCNIELNSVFKSEAVNTSPAIQTFTRESAILVLRTHRAGLHGSREGMDFHTFRQPTLGQLVTDRAELSALHQLNVAVYEPRSRKL